MISLVFVLSFSNLFLKSIVSTQGNHRLVGSCVVFVAGVCLVCVGQPQFVLGMIVWV